MANRVKDRVDILLGGVASFGGALIRIGGRLVFVLIAGHLYGSVALGTLAYLTLWIEGAAALAAYGQRESILPVLAEAEANGESIGSALKTGLALAFVLGVVLAVLLGAVLWSPLGLGALDDPLRFIVCVIPLVALTEILLVATQFRRKMRYTVWSRAIAEPWTLAFAAAGFSLWDAAEWGLVAAYSLGAVSALIIALIGFSQLIGLRALVRAPWSWRNLFSHVRYSTPTALASLMTLLYHRVDIFFMWHFASPAFAGIYYVAQQWASLAERLRQVITPILAPVVSQTLAAGQREEAGWQLGQASRWIMTLILLLTVMLGVYGAPVLELMGPGMSAGATILTILLFAELIDGTFRNMEFPVIFENPIRNVQLVGLGFGLHLVGSLILTPAIGPIGPAVSLLLSFSVLNLTLFAAARTEHGLRFLTLEFLKPIGAAAITAPLLALFAAYFKGPHWVIAGLLAAPPIYLGLLRLFGISREDRELWRLLKQRKREISASNI